MRDMQAAGREMVLNEANEKVLFREEAERYRELFPVGGHGFMAVTENAPLRSLPSKVGRAAMQHYCKMGG